MKNFVDRRRYFYIIFEFDREGVEIICEEKILGHIGNETEFEVIKGCTCINLLLEKNIILIKELKTANGVFSDKHTFTFRYEGEIMTFITPYIVESVNYYYKLPFLGGNYNLVKNLNHLEKGVILFGDMLEISDKAKNMDLINQPLGTKEKLKDIKFVWDILYPPLYTFEPVINE